MRRCVFCRVIGGELPATYEFKGQRVVAFRDIKPSAPVHVLIVSKKHIGKLSEATESDKELLGEIQLAAGNIACRLNIDKAFKLVTNNGRSAGQVVNHLHYHLLGGWKTPSVKIGHKP